jgi:hypothetical protein
MKCWIAALAAALVVDGRGYPSAIPSMVAPAPCPSSATLDHPSRLASAGLFFVLETL